MTSTTAMLSFSVPPPLCQRPCPGARRKLVAPPNLSVSSFRKPSNQSLPIGSPVAGFFRKKDLHEVGGACAHEALRRDAPCQLSSSVSVVTVSTCSPKRFM